MGGQTYEKEISKKLSQQELDKLLAELQEQDEYDNGHNGYTGDSQTVDKIILKDETFNDYDEALNYCLDHCSKWHHFIAVYRNTIVKNKIKTHTLIAGIAAC